MNAYDQLTDRDDLIVAREELEALADYAQNDSDSERLLHGLDTAIAVLSILIDRCTAE